MSLYENKYIKLNINYFWIPTFRLNQDYMKKWIERRQYLEAEWVNNLAELIRFAIKRARAVQQTATAEHHPARLQLFISTVHKPPTEANTFLMNTNVN